MSDSKTKTVYGEDVYLNNLVLSFAQNLATPATKTSLDGSSTYLEFSANFMVNKVTNTEACDAIAESIGKLMDDAGIGNVKDLNVTAIHDQRGDLRDYDSPSYSGHKGALPGHLFFTATTSASDDGRYGGPDLYKTDNTSGEVELVDATAEDFYAGAIVTGVFTSVLKWADKNKRYSHKYYLKSVIKTAEGERLAVGSSRDDVKTKASEMLKARMKGELGAKMKAVITTVVTPPTSQASEPVLKPQVAQAEKTHVKKQPVKPLTEQVVTPVEVAAPKKKFSDLMKGAQ